MKKKVLLQTIVDTELGAFVRRAAKLDGLTVAAWLRRLLLARLHAARRRALRRLARPYANGVPVPNMFGVVRELDPKRKKGMRFKR